jgi:kinesin family protein 22
VPRAVARLFELLSGGDVPGPRPRAVNVSMSFMEIYNERVFDLLDAPDATAGAPGRPARRELQLRENCDSELVVAGLTETAVANADDFARCYARGIKRRSTGSTQLNDASSRSHCMLVIKAAFTLGDQRVTGKLHLIDLAGK